MKAIPTFLLSLALSAPLWAVPLGNLGPGVTAQETATGTGYILFSPEGLTPRFTLYSGQATHFAAVYHANDTWYYYNNEDPIAFTPLATDVLVASVDFTADTPAVLLSGQNTYTHGIQTGFASGDLGVLVNQYDGVADPGEFTITGTDIKLNVPQWWVDRNVINTNDSNNLAIANLGQAKHFAYQAHAELLSTRLPGGAGFALNSLFPVPPANPDAAWYEAQKAALNLGQLKAVAKPFYDHLNATSPLWVERQFHMNGLSTLNTHYFQDSTTNYFYPWNPTTPIEENLKVASIGQLKSVFALRFNESSDGDILPDLWEYNIINSSITDAITSLADVTLEGDFDNDGVDNGTEYQINTDPTVFSNAPIDWVALRNVTLNNSIPATPSLTRTHGFHGYWNGGARSKGVLSGDGSVFASAPSNFSLINFGLSEIFLDYAHTRISYNVYFRNENEIRVLENGSDKGPKTTYLPGDVIEIRRTGTTVRYLKNGVVFYTSTTPSTRPLYAAASIANNGNTLSNTTSTGFTSTLDTDEDGLIDSYEQQFADANPSDSISSIQDVTGYQDYDKDGLSNAVEYALKSDPLNTPNQGWLPVAWTNHRNTTSSQPSENFGTTLSKAPSAHGYNADATSADALLGDGGVSCRVSSLDTRSLIGLNLANDSASNTDLTYSIYFGTDGRFFVVENGVTIAAPNYFVMV
jgi:hypothetical protein